jgi:hypothetical protein
MVKKMRVKEIYVIFIHLFDSGILSIIDLNKKKNFIAFTNILLVSTVFSTPYLLLDIASRLQWPVTQISTFHQFFS